MSKSIAQALREMQEAVGIPGKRRISKLDIQKAGEAAAKGVISEAVEIAKNNSLKKEDVPHIIEQISEEIIEIFHRDWT